MADPLSAPTVDDNHAPENYGGGALGGFMSIYGPRIKAKQQEELNQRAMERDHFWKQMNDPALSVQPGDDDATKTRKQQQLAWLQAEYAKRSGTESKGLLQKAIPFIQHLRGHKVDGQDGGGGESLGLPASMAPGGMPAPPQQGAAPTAAVPPPPTTQAAAPAAASAPAAIPPPPSGADVASTIAEGTFSRGLAHDKAATQQGNALALEQSKATQLQAAEVASQALDKLFPNLPASQKQTMLARKLGFVPPVKMVTKTVADPESATGASNVSYDAITGEVYTTQTGAFMPRGYIPTETISRDPYGNQTVSVRTPMALGVGGAAAKPSAAKAAPTASSSGGGGGRAPAVPPPLDADGHISGTPQGYTPQAIEGTNRLLDGEDVNKLPAQSRAVSGKLARQYGWEQGKFTPKEQTQLREATTYLQQMAESPALEALDGGFADRTQLSVVLSAPEEKGAVGSMLANASAMHLDDKQAQFVQLYNQIVQTIGGLRQIAGGGKQTESAIQRLLTELPNPTTTRDSKDARQRLQRVLSEITVAMKKGTFSGAEAGPQKKQAYQKDGKYYDATTHQEIKQGAK